MNRSVRDQSHLTRSPQPLRSPSPDIVTANMITSTKTPTAEMPLMPSTRHYRQDVPLMEQIIELRRQNEELRQQLSRDKSATGRQSLPTDGSRQTQVNNLLRQLRERQLEIEALKAQAEGSASKLSKSSKKLTLVGSDIGHMRELNGRIQQLTDQNKRLREELQEISTERETSEEVHRLRTRLNELQLNNENLKRQLRSKNSSYVLRTEPQDLDTERINIEMRHLREDVYHQLDRMFQRINEKLQELDRRTVDIMSRQTTLLAQTRGNKKYQGSTAGTHFPEFDQSHSNYNTPDKPFPTTVTSQYVVQPGAGKLTNTVQPPPSQTTPPAHNTHLQVVAANQMTTISKLQTELNRALSDGDRSRQENRTIREQNNYLSAELARLRSQLAGKHEPSDVVRRLESENSDLRNQLNSKVFALDQQGRDRILKDNEVSELNRIIGDLNRKLDYIQTEKNQQLIRLQGENKFFKDSLEKLGRENNDLSAQLERARTNVRLVNSVVVPSAPPSKELELQRQVGQLKAEVLQLQAELTFTKNRQQHSDEIQSSLEQEAERMRKVNGEITRQLNQALEEINREKHLVSLRDGEVKQLRDLLDRMNADLNDSVALRTNNEELKAECFRLKRIADEGDKSIAILKSEKEYVIRQAEDYVRMLEQLRGALRTKEEELIQMLQTRKSPTIEAYLKDLMELKRELESLRLEPLQMEIHDRNERLKVLLSEKLMNARLSTKQLQDIEALVRENDKLRKEALSAETRLITAKEEADRLRALMESRDHERASMERQISELKAIITEYINREVVYKEGTLSAETQKELRQMEEEISATQLQQQRSLQDITTLKANFQQAIRKLDSISTKIREELQRPAHTVVSQTTVRTTTTRP